MKITSHRIIKILPIFILITLLTACYSFRGGSLPEHIKTIQIRNVVDNSNFGDPTYKEYLFNKMNEVIRRDNSMSIETSAADSRLSIQLQSIQESVLSTTGASGLEKERKITVGIAFEFYDNTKKQIVASNRLTMSQSFLISGLPNSRKEAINKCLELIADEILNNMISSE